MRTAQRSDAAGTAGTVVAAAAAVVSAWFLAASSKRLVVAPTNEFRGNHRLCEEVS